MNVEKMRRQLERNEDSYARRALASGPQLRTLPFPALQRLGEQLFAALSQPGPRLAQGAGYRPDIRGVVDGLPDGTLEIRDAVKVTGEDAR